MPTRNGLGRNVNREVSAANLAGVEPPGCDVAAWFRLRAGEFGAGPWTADEAIHVAAGAKPSAGWRGAGTNVTR